MSLEPLLPLIGALALFVNVLTVWVVFKAINEAFSAAATVVAARIRKRRRRVEKFADAFALEADRIRLEIEPKFDLWWNEIGKSVIKNNAGIYEKLGLPVDFEELSEHQKSHITRQAQDIVSSAALEFAVHLANKPAHDAFIKDVRQVDKRQADVYQTEFETHMEHHRSKLAGLGIDTSEFESEFAVNATA